MTKTRDCVDPWTTVFVQANGDVAPCCWARPIGNLHKELMEQVLRGDAARKLRKDLLTGELPEDCVKCPARGYIDSDALATKVRALADETEAEIGFEERRAIRDAHRELERCERELAVVERGRVELKIALGVARSNEAHASELAARVAILDRRSGELAPIIAQCKADIARLTYPLRKPRRHRMRRWVLRMLGHS